MSVADVLHSDYFEAIAAEDSSLSFLPSLTVTKIKHMRLRLGSLKGLFYLRHNFSARFKACYSFRLTPPNSVDDEWFSFKFSSNDPYSRLPEFWTMHTFA